MDIKENSKEEVDLNRLVYLMLREGQHRIGYGKQNQTALQDTYGLTQIERDKLFYVLYGVFKVLLKDCEIKPK